MYEDMIFGPTVYVPAENQDAEDICRQVNDTQWGMLKDISDMSFNNKNKARQT